MLFGFITDYLLSWLIQIRFRKENRWKQMDMTHHRLKDHLDKQEGSIKEVRDKRDRIRNEVETLKKTKIWRKLEKIESHLEMRMEELTSLEKEVEAFEAEHPHAAVSAPADCWCCFFLRPTLLTIYTQLERLASWFIDLGNSRFIHLRWSWGLTQQEQGEQSSVWDASVGWLHSCQWIK